MNIENSFTCLKCKSSTSFPIKEKLRLHDIEYHTKSFTVKINDIEHTIIQDEDNKYKCPICCKKYTTKSGIIKHANKAKCDNKDVPQEEYLQDTTDLEFENKVITVPSVSEIYVDIKYESIFNRSQSEASLYACQQSFTDKDNKEKILFILDTLKLKPFGIKDNNGLEQNALAHQNIIEMLINNDTFFPILPAKRKYGSEDSVCQNCNIPPVPGLKKILSISPYTKALSSRHYLELTKDICYLLNDDWEIRPQTKYFCAQVLSGAIIINNNNGEGIIINCVEAYGRTGPVDIHREQFGSIKSSSLSTSLPPPKKLRYEDVWPVTINSHEGSKIVIGTQTCNLLITSSLRLDKCLPPSLGATTNNFFLRSEKDSLATSIYLDKESVEKALILSKNKDTTCLQNSNIIHQLRQLTTKFHCPSTYYLCRATSFFTKSHTNHPYTIFTLCEFDRARGNGKYGSMLLRRIALNILDKGQEGTLDKKFVLNIKNHCTGNVLSILDDILHEFILVSPSTEIRIINNKQLNGHLERLAKQLAPYIATANKSVSTSIVDTFSSF
ncbi:hypothetical protein BJ944DRAFT_201527 [Cunninghamella echinulata]|nr:hypothetical protein BJ944DRAFT_201527 [Cunninghamella echinulata]